MRQVVPCVVRPILLFQSTHPRGVRHLISSQINLNEQISIHAPTWGATEQQYEWNPKLFISIHAPTWGATSCLFFISRDVSISIHAPTWGATCWLSNSSFRRSNFNPRTHVGCDSGQQERHNNSCISIHAPTWGATRAQRL